MRVYWYIRAIFEGFFKIISSHLVLVFIVSSSSLIKFIVKLLGNLYLKLPELIETSELEGLELLIQGDVGVAVLIESVVRDHPVKLQSPGYVVEVTVRLE